MRRFLFALGLTVGVTHCKPKAEENAANRRASTHTSSTHSPASGTGPEAREAQAVNASAPVEISHETAEIDRLVALWNAAHAANASDTLRPLYSGSVLFYGRQQSAAACVKSTLGLLAKTPDYRQSIEGKLHTHVQGAEAFSGFVKRVSIAGKVTDYPSYLGFLKTPAGWKISIEGDEVTDATLRKKSGVKVQDVVTGDWDGDGTAEPVYLVPPKLHVDTSGFDDCVGPCSCRLVFKKQPALVIETCLGGVPVNEGDLDGDGADEIGVLPEWFTSCWHGYRIYSLRGGAWSQVMAISTHCDQWEKGVDAIERDKAHPGFVITRSTSMEDFSLVVRSVPFQSNRASTSR